MSVISSPQPAQAPSPLVALRAAPLRRVLCVLNFQPILRVSDPTGAGIATFQEAIRSNYPELRKETVHELEFRPNSAGHVIEPPNVVSYPVWQFVDSVAGWTAALSRSSLSVEADGDSYAGRDALIDRFAAVVQALHSTFDPVVCTRLGFRYLNLFQGDKLAGIRGYLQPEILGYGPPDGDDGVRSSFSQVEIRRGGVTFLLKYGFVEAGFANEMMTTPLEEAGWLVDIDGFTATEPKGGEAGLRACAVQITNGVCELFRESVTSSFLEEYRHA